MTKGTRTVIFVLAASAANILVTIAIFILLLVIYGLTLGRVLQVSTAAPVILVAFLVSVLASAFIYKKGLDWARKRWNLEEMLGFNRKR